MPESLSTDIGILLSKYRYTVYCYLNIGNTRCTYVQRVFYKWALMAKSENMRNTEKKNKRVFRQLLMKTKIAATASSINQLTMAKYQTLHSILLSRQSKANSN